MSSEYEYGEYNGEETLNKEYKLFTFHPNGMNFETTNIKIAEKLFISGKWDFNECVINNLNYYLDTYIPKYTTAFLNKYSKSDIGEMYFGISDDGIIQGIPYKGEFDFEMVKNKVDTILKSDKLMSSSDLSKYIDIELINVDTSSFNINNYHNTMINTYNKEKIEYYKKFNKYVKEKNKWFKKVKHYNTKLISIMNSPNTRQELIEYIKKKDSNQEKVINILNSDFIFDDIHGTDVSLFKLKKDNPWYWVCLWKDEMIDYLRPLKPKPPTNWANKYLPINSITTIVDMIPIWLNKENINLYLIKFTFRKPNIPLDISYKYGNDFISCYRSTMFSEPLCQPF